MKVPAMNLCGKKVMHYRKALGWSQTKLAANLAAAGEDIGRDAIAKIETGRRCVTDIELVKIAEVTIDLPKDEENLIVEA